MMICTTTTRTQPRHPLWLDIIVRHVKTFLDTLKNILIPQPIRAGGAPESVRSAVGSRACALVLDASGSMMDTDWKPSRLGAARDAAKAFARRLSDEEPDALVAVVAYGCLAKTVCHLTPARELSKVHSAIDQVDIMGSTNMKAGMKKALRLLNRYRGRTCQVVLLSDGHNTGGSPRNVGGELKEFAVVECVGIGGSPDDVDETLLKALASAGPDRTPRYRWIGDKERLVRHFHNLAGRITRA